MLGQIKLWQAKIVGWARHRVSGKHDVGASLVEYALLLALIAVVAIGALTFLGGAVSNTLNNVGHQFAAAGAGGGGGGSGITFTDNGGTAGAPAATGGTGTSVAITLTPAPSATVGYTYAVSGPGSEIFTFENGNQLTVGGNGRTTGRTPSPSR